MRACTWCGVAAIALSIATTVQWPADARQAPAQAVPPPAAGGRGPNPIPGLAGLVETPTTGPAAPRFEVASVKRNQLGAGGGNPSGSRSLAGGAVRTTNATLRMLVRTAYRLGLTDEIVGGPPWIDTYGFDVDARPAKPVTLAESAYMMRTLLADRFKLVARKESREGPVYALVLARRDGALGPQIKRPAGECVMTVPAFARGDANASTPAKLSAWPPPGRPGRRCGVGPDGDTMKAGSVTMTTLVTLLTPLMDRPVVDKTGLTGMFDFDLRYDGSATSFLGRGRATAVSPDVPSDPARGPSIFTALQEQLGLRLESQRGAVNVLAVVSAELPTEN
jgi:uncharacterized protein (TIGR03435 family)